MTKFFACGDCRWFGSVICGFYNIPRIAEDPICQHFQTKDGEIPRYCRMAQDIDRMAENLVFYDDNYVGLSGWYFRGIRYFSKDKAIEAAKSWLMELEDGNES